MSLFLLWFLFGIGIFIQAVYLLLIFGKIVFFSRKKSIEESSPSEGVTVVIAARNEYHNLKNLIPKIFEQEYEKFELLIIDDRSTDRTHRLLLEMMAIYPKLRTVIIKYTPEHVTAKKYALTLGIKVAKNDVILLTDADCIPESKLWIQKMTAPVRLEKKTFSIGFSGYEKKSGFLNNWIQFETLLTALFYLSFGLWKMPFMGVGRNLCYRKNFFMEAKAFKGLWQIEGGDDDLFVNRYASGKNTALVIDPDANTLSKAKTNRKDYFRQKKRHLHAGKYYRGKDKQKIGFYAFSHVLFWAGGIGLLFYFGLEENWEQFFIVFGIILLRSTLFSLVMYLSSKKIQGVNQTKIPWLYDFLYLGYFWVIGTISYQAKTIQWK